ncbi:MAG: hypothetical protein Q8O92_01410 [Candidatus Latescibacter sp.]|nr:hypothetical protein [Candidatus Latescibacter sp.]
MRRINEIVHGKSSISADTSLLLLRYFGFFNELVGKKKNST